MIKLNYCILIMIRCVKVGNIVRITHNNERFICIIDSLPKIIPTDEELKKSKKVKYMIKLSTQYSNHLSSVLQRKFLQHTEYNIKNIIINLVSLDEYKEIEEVIFKPNISSEVRSYWMMQKTSNKKLIKRALKNKLNIMSAMGKRPPSTFNHKILTVDFESVMNKKEIQKKVRRNMMMKKAKKKTKDPIEMYQLKQRMEKLKINRIEKGIKNKSNNVIKNKRKNKK